MKKAISILIILFAAINAIAQDLNKVIREIEGEGKHLYQLEVASWIGTDMLRSYTDKRGQTGGYFSYLENDSAKCVFFSKGPSPRVIATVLFDPTFDVEKATIQHIERDFDDMEYDLYSIRQKTLNAVNSDTLFKIYTNASFNLVPVIRNGEKKVYVMTGPRDAGVVILGNDYLVTFDQNNNIIAKKQLHRNIIPIDFDTDKKAETTIHSHAGETGDFITPTDICTLMLYAKYAGWKKHYVLSLNYVSIWDCNDNTLTIMTRKAWDKINEDKKRK